MARALWRRCSPRAAEPHELSALGEPREACAGLAAYIASTLRRALGHAGTRLSAAVRHAAAGLLALAGLLGAASTQMTWSEPSGAHLPRFGQSPWRFCFGSSAASCLTFAPADSLAVAFARAGVVADPHELGRLVVASRVLSLVSVVVNVAGALTAVFAQPPVGPLGALVAALTAFVTSMLSVIFWGTIHARALKTLPFSIGFAHARFAGGATLMILSVVASGHSLLPALALALGFGGSGASSSRARASPPPAARAAAAAETIASGFRKFARGVTAAAGGGTTAAPAGEASGERAARAPAHAPAAAAGGKAE